MYYAHEQMNFNTVESNSKILVLCNCLPSFEQAVCYIAMQTTIDVKKLLIRHAAQFRHWS
jgi:hypothetical protein